MSGGDDEIVFNDGAWGSTAAADVPPRPTVPDAAPVPGSPIDAALALLHGAANGDDPETDAELLAKHADRQNQYSDAMAKFPENEAQSASALTGAGGPEGMSQMLPQLVSGIAGAVSGAVGGLVQPLTQIPQQGIQAGTQALQPLLGALQSAGSGAESGLDSEAAGGSGGYGDDYGYDEGGGAGGGGGAGEGGGYGDEYGDELGPDGTGPTGYLGAPAIPISTFPSAAAPSTGATVPAAAPAPAGGMGGMPMAPMAGGMGAGGAGGADNKQDTKKVVPPTVANSRPVQGRFTGNRLGAPTVMRVRTKKTAETTTSEETGK